MRTPYFMSREASYAADEAQWYTKSGHFFYIRPHPAVVGDDQAAADEVIPPWQAIVREGTMRDASAIRCAREKGFAVPKPSLQRS